MRPGRPPVPFGETLGTQQPDKSGRLYKTIHPPTPDSMRACAQSTRSLASVQDCSTVMGPNEAYLHRLLTMRLLPDIGGHADVVAMSVSRDGHHVCLRDLCSTECVAGGSSPDQRMEEER